MARFERPPRTLEDMEREMKQLNQAHAMFLNEKNWPKANDCLTSLLRLSAEHEVMRLATEPTVVDHAARRTSVEVD